MFFLFLITLVAQKQRGKATKKSDKKSHSSAYLNSIKPVFQVYFEHTISFYTIHFIYSTFNGIQTTLTHCENLNHKRPAIVSHHTTILFNLINMLGVRTSRGNVTKRSSKLVQQERTANLIATSTEGEEDRKRSGVGIVEFLFLPMSCQNSCQLLEGAQKGLTGFNVNKVPRNHNPLTNKSQSADRPTNSWQLTSCLEDSKTSRSAK